MSDLSDREKLVILAALQTVSPIGGGSEQFTLFRKLCEEWNVPVGSEDFDTLFYRYNNVVLEGALDAEIVVRVK